MSVLEDILKHPRFDNDRHDDNGREHKADWKGDWGRDKDWHEEGKFCWKDDDGRDGKRWEGKNGDDSESGCGGQSDDCGDLQGVLASLSNTVELIEAAIEKLDCAPSCETAHADSFDNTDVLA